MRKNDEDAPALQQLLTTDLAAEWNRLQAELKILYTYVKPIDYPAIEAEIDRYFTANDEYKFSTSETADLLNFDTVLNTISNVSARLGEIASMLEFNLTILKGAYDTTEELLTQFSNKSSDSTRRAEAKSIILQEYVQYKTADAYMRRVERLINVLEGKANKISRRISIIEQMTRTGLYSVDDIMKALQNNKPQTELQKQFDVK